jgi:hypothetical protein
MLAAILLLGLLRAAFSALRHAKEARCYSLSLCMDLGEARCVKSTVPLYCAHLVVLCALN